jgi:hypothetical protein
MKNDGGSAFPQGVKMIAHNQEIDCGLQGGMSLRDYFAALAMNGYLSSGAFSNKDVRIETAKVYYEWADAMLKARNG